MWLIRDGVLNVRGQEAVNVKQARCLLHVAAWVQKKKTAEWLEDPSSGLAAASPQDEKWHRERGQDLFRQVLSGPAGTGKTTMVLLIEHFHEFFFSSSPRVDGVAAPSTTPCFAKTAPTNTAARINGGDTCHAFYRLPFLNLSTKKAKLSANVLLAHRQRIMPLVHHVIDEMSMLTPQQNHQIDVRCKEGQAGGVSATQDYGGIATTLAGDFSQMPPVRAPSLTKEVDAADLAPGVNDGDKAEGGAEDDVGEMTKAITELVHSVPLSLVFLLLFISFFASFLFAHRLLSCSLVFFSLFSS